MELTSRECRLLVKALRRLEEQIERSVDIMLDIDQYDAVGGGIDSYMIEVRTLSSKIYDEWVGTSYRVAQGRPPAPVDSQAVADYYNETESTGE